MSFVAGKPLILVAIAVAVIVAGAAAFMLMGGGGAQPSTTTTQSQSTTTTTTTSQPAEQATLEGYWHGTYRSEETSSRGEFCFRLTKASVGYVGVLAINDVANVYVGTGIPLVVRVSGNAITLGWVAGPGVTFSGTISGDSMQGTWQIGGGQYSDQGTWAASKGTNTLCSALETITMPPTQTSPTTTSASPQETYDSAPDLEATGDLATVDGAVRQLLGGIFGGVKLAEQGEAMGYTYGVYVVPRLLTVDDGNAVVQGLRSMGYQIIASTVSSEEVMVQALLPEGTLLIVRADIGSQEISVVKKSYWPGMTTTTTTPPTETTTTFVNEYDSATDMQASGVLAVVDPMLRQAFEQVFGGAKLESTESYNLSAEAVYIVPRQVSHTDADALVQALQQAGFQVTDWNAEQDYFIIYVSATIEDAEYSASIEFMGYYEVQRLYVHVEKAATPQDLYNSAQDLQPLGILADVDPALRSVFEQLFGGAKLTSQTSYAGTAYGEYIVPRPVALNDVESLVQLLQQANFTIMGQQVDSSGAFINAMKPSYMVMIQLYFDSQTIEVQVFAQG